MQKEMKDFKKENAGRSMTEMLGVLAIIGVLSLGGIIGYKLAMNRYAANQIAYEINMMKTDAKVKIMQGNDALTLGQPYDGGTIRFGDYGTTFGCSFVQDENAENIVVEEAETCQVANAYYIEVQNIPEGICKPLANLIENMNDLIAFDINLTESEEGRVGDDCQGDNNTLNAVFSAEPGDLDVLKCDSEKDCSGGLHCLNHLCVECETHEHCQEKGNDYCAANTCHDCKDNQIFDATLGCVNCTSNDNCTNQFFPYCNTSVGECEPCKTDDQCDTSQNEHCQISTGECVVCNSNEIWDKDNHQCIINDCQDTKTCPSGYFCLSTRCSCSNNQETNCENYKCTLIDDTSFVQSVIDHETYYGATLEMNWWSAKRYCEAAKERVAGAQGIMASWGNPDFKCAHEIQLGSEFDWGYCHADNITFGKQQQDIYNPNLSETIYKLRDMYNMVLRPLWLSNTNFQCGGWYVYLKEGRVHTNWYGGVAGECLIDDPSRLHGCMNIPSYFPLCR